MITYFKMKYNEWKVKAMFYGTIASIMDNQNEIKGYLDLAKKLFDELRSVPFDDLRSEFIGKLAEIIHEENKKTEE